MKQAFINRGSFDIIYEILSLCQKPSGKTRILYKCNLSYDQLQKYLGYLISHRLLELAERNRKEFFKTTDKAEEFLRGYENLNSFLRNRQHMFVLLQK